MGNDCSFGRPEDPAFTIQIGNVTNQSLAIILLVLGGQA